MTFFYILSWSIFFFLFFFSWIVKIVFLWMCSLDQPVQHVDTGRTFVCLFFPLRRILFTRAWLRVDRYICEVSRDSGSGSGTFCMSVKSSFWRVFEWGIFGFSQNRKCSKLSEFFSLKHILNILTSSMTLNIGSKQLHNISNLNQASKIFSSNPLFWTPCPGRKFSLFERVPWNEKTGAATTERKREPTFFFFIFFFCPSSFFIFFIFFSSFYYFYSPFFFSYYYFYSPFFFFFFKNYLFFSSVKWHHATCFKSKPVTGTIYRKTHCYLLLFFLGEKQKVVCCV